MGAFHIVDSHGKISPRVLIFSQNVCIIGRKNGTLGERAMYESV